MHCGDVMDSRLLYLFDHKEHGKHRHNERRSPLGTLGTYSINMVHWYIPYNHLERSIWRMSFTNKAVYVVLRPSMGHQSGRCMRSIGIMFFSICEPLDSVESPFFRSSEASSSASVLPASAFITGLRFTGCTSNHEYALDVCRVFPQPLSVSRSLDQLC